MKKPWNKKSDSKKAPRPLREATETEIKQIEGQTKTGQ